MSLPGLSSSSFDEHNTKLQASALKATRNAATLPTDINFYRSIDTGLARDIDTVSSRVLNLTNKLLGLSSSTDAKPAKGKGKAKLEDQDDVVDNFHSLVIDVMEQLFERTDGCLDQVLGRDKGPAIAINLPTSAPAPAKRKVIAPKGGLDPAIHHASYLTKPQLSFKRKPDNSDAPWYPSLSHKYNAKVPLGHVYTDTNDSTNMEGSSALMANHPYRYEINHITYPAHVYAPTTPESPPSLSETPFTWISTPEALQSMLDKLRSKNEIAVDLEHHSYRSYSGFLCLMQISTREEDFVVDVITLRDEMEVLNEVFTDPKIVKVFHGAESDIVWLQQDFNLYVVNLFDTFHASKLLEFPRHGLANLLEMYCDYNPDKRYQLADWRIRPLPNEMLEYARSDTHFLLFIYDNLRNALLDRAASRSRSSSPPSAANTTTPNSIPVSAPPPTVNASTNPAHALINHVLTRSAETCLRVYTKEPYDHASGTGPGGWDTLAKKWNKPFFTAASSDPMISFINVNAVQKMQRAVYKTVHWWREKVAREEDESTRYVLPNQFLFRIAEAPPADLAALLRMFGSSVPQVVKRRAKELLDEIREAVKDNLGKEGTKGEGEKDEGIAEDKAEDVKKGVESKEQVEVNDSQKHVQDPNEKLWGTDKINEMLKTSSSLLGQTQTAIRRPPPAASAYATARSALFANTTKDTSAPTKDQLPSGSLQFQKLVERINSTLVIMPTVPKVATTSTTMVERTAIEHKTQSSADTTAKVDESTGMQIEIPFVPAAHRKTTIIEKAEKDTIVVVGQPKAKKRKRAKGNAASTTQTRGKDPETETTLDNVGAGVENSTEADPETFDFVNVPNILDDNPDPEDRKPLKKKPKRGKGGQFFGDFPAPPKAHSEFKGGNQSHTFK